MIVYMHPGYFCFILAITFVAGGWMFRAIYLLFEDKPVPLTSLDSETEFEVIGILPRRQIVVKAVDDPQNKEVTVCDVPLRNMNAVEIGSNFEMFDVDGRPCMLVKQLPKYWANEIQSVNIKV